MFKWICALLCGLICSLSVMAEPVAERLQVEVVRTLPHDSDAFTQGLLLHEGHLYESTGLYGRSQLRQVELESGNDVRRRALDPAWFGEGLAMVGNTLIQLTWKEGLALVYDLDDFALLRAHEYGGEGWGLCYDGTSLWMSDGSQTLYRRHPDTFALLETLAVTLPGRDLGQLNELECVGDVIYANVFRDSRILKIDKATGRVLAEIDATPLLVLNDRLWHREAVLNGIAYEPASDTFYLTGKWWPSLYQVRFVAAGL